ncbi:MAG: amidohydrolase 2 [Actinomycetia bacterium]|nr:amidohydrolase 2 [Actinomycetes bacterium]
MTTMHDASHATADAGPRNPRWYVSVDDHVIEPRNVWTDRLPSKYRDIGPRIVRANLDVKLRAGKHQFTETPDGKPCDVWAYEDLRWPIDRLHASAGVERDALRSESVTFEEMLPGCYDPVARLADMDLNHTAASMAFPTFPRFCGQTFMDAKDKELALLCVQAWNDWNFEEFCAGSGGRLLPLSLIPLWDADLAAAEVRRNAARGGRAVAFSELPSRLGLPSIHDKDRYWEPFFQACDETKTSICVHIGSSSMMPITSEDMPPAVGSTLTFNNALLALADWLFSGVLLRHPDLNVVYSEGQIGWIPFLLERADNVWVRNRGWSGVDLPEAPSYYYRRQVHGCLFDDIHGAKSMDEVGIDNVLFEVDYPHCDSTWPHTDQVIDVIEGILSPEDCDKLFTGNAQKLFGIADAVVDRAATASR